MNVIGLDRLPPQNIEAEQAVLGAIILVNKAMRKIGLMPDDFYKESHKQIFIAMLKLRQENIPIDLVNLTEILSKHGMIDRCGGGSYLSTIANMVPTAANIKHYADIVKEKSNLRKVIIGASDIVNKAYDENIDIDSLKHSIKDIIRETRGETKIITSRDLAKQTVDYVDLVYGKGNKCTGIPSGFFDIDERTGGFQNGELTVLASRPGVGKTALMDNIAINIATNGLPVGIFNLEMTEQQSGIRHIADIGSIPSKGLRTGCLDNDHYKAVVNAAGKLASLPLFYCFDGNLNINQIWDHSEEMVEEHGVKKIFLDYLQLIRSFGKVFDREQVVSEISRTLKLMAKTFNIPVTVLSQLNRSCESRTNKRPLLSDLRESGSIEQDADVVIFIYRDDYYNPKSKEKGKAELIFAKARSFQVGIEELAWQDSMTRFRNIDKGLYD